VGRWTRRLLILGVLLGTIGLLGVVTLFWYYGRDLPSVSKLRDYEPPQTTRVLDRDGALVGEIYHQRRTVVSMERIPRVFVLSVLAAEDADFYHHEGLDYPGILRALVRDVLAGKAVQGASTITQQVVKLLLLTPDRTIERKTRELILARRLERELTKDEILHLYLNHINYGHGRYGVQEASQYYFGKDVEDLTLAESSLIAGAPQAPARLSPRDHPEAAKRRQKYVLNQLEQKRAKYWPDLDPERIEKARNTEVELAPAPESRNEAPGIVARVRSLLRNRVGEEAFRKGGYTVHTTLDIELQHRTRKAVQKGLKAIDKRHGYRAPLERKPKRKRRSKPDPIDELHMGRTYTAVVTARNDEEGTLELDVGGHDAYVDLDDFPRYNPKELPPSEFAEKRARIPVSILRIPDTDEQGEPHPAEARLELGPQGAAIVLDARTRDVLAMVGSYKAVPGFNRATRAVRQPGSTFKPIVYAYAIKDRELTPASTIIDAPAVYDKWRPRNYETWRHEGPVRLREALARSINLVAVRVMDRVGPKNVVKFAQKLGITTELDPSLALALGSSGVRPAELTNAYATFAAGGRWAPYRLVGRIEGPDGREVPLPEREPPRDVMTPAEAYVVTDMLTSVIESGTGKAAQRLDQALAGKTGTSNKARDAWFMGYNPSTVAGVWVGFDDRRPLGSHESGGRSALPIWMEIMRAAGKGKPQVAFPKPSGVVTARIDPQSGKLAYEGREGAIEEVFVEGTVPTETARPPDVADPNTFLMEQVGSAGSHTSQSTEELTP
jgi:penicillin-binding protein 1A